MSLRRIGLLAILVAALGAYLYFYEVPEAERAARKEKLVGVESDAVTGLTLTYPDREIELRKTDGTWRVTKPVDALADEAAVKALLGTLTGAEVQKTLDEMPSDLEPFGLAKPTVTVQVATAAGEQPPIAVGKNTTIGGKTYVRKGEEQKIYLTTSSIAFGLDKQVKDLRDKQILSFQDADVQRVTIEGRERPTVTLARKDKDAWTVAPGDLPADPTEVRSYLATLRSLRATDFPDDAPSDLGRYGLAEPRLTVTVATGKDGAQTQTLLIGGDKTDGTQKLVYAKRASGPVVYGVGEWAVKSLDKGVNQFRDKTVLGFDTGRVGRMRLERKDGASVVMVRGADGAWQVEGAEAGKSKDTMISRFLDDVHDLRGSDVAAEDGNLAPFGLDTPALRIALVDKDGQPMGTILTTKHAEKYYAALEGGQTIFEVRDYMFNRLDKQPKDFVEAPKAEGSAVGTTSTTLAGDGAAPGDEDAAEDAEPFEDLEGDEGEEAPLDEE